MTRIKEYSIIGLNNLKIWLLIGFFLFIQYSDIYSQGIKKVVIDPGHGGHDPGCLGVKSKEKEVCLAMALKLGKLIESNYKDIQVIYTRNTDVFVELHERANIANKNKADLFICIHANSGPKHAFGSETYVMGLHKTEENLNVAKRENSVILMEENYNTTYEGFNPNSDEDMIAITLMQSTYLEQSLDIASKIQNQFTQIGRKNRGVKQAGFLVLYKTAMPSILIETGFLTHEEEEKFLADPKNQEKMSSAMFQAFKEYKESIDKRISQTDGVKKANISNDGLSKQPITQNTKPDTKNNTSNQNTDSVTVKKSIPVKKEDISINTYVQQQTNQKDVGNFSDTIVIKSQAIKKNTSDTASNIEPNKIITSNKLSPAESFKIQEQQFTNLSVIEKNSKNTIVFRVQFYSSPVALTMEQKKIEGINNIFEYKDKDGIYKYTVGESDSTNELLYLQNKMREKGYKDAFIVAFENGARIPMQEALKKIKK